MTYEKAVTSTKYYDDIARTITQYNPNGNLSFTPKTMALGVAAAAIHQYDSGYSDGRIVLETELLGGAW